MIDETDDMEVIGEAPELEPELLEDELTNESKSRFDEVELEPELLPLPKKIRKPKAKVIVKPKVKPKVKAKPKPKVKEIKKKHKKRGPKGVQWKGWKIPYQDSCTMGQLFIMCMKKGGMKRRDFIKFAEKRGAHVTRTLRNMLSGHSRGWIWDSDDSHNRIRVSNPRIANSNWKKKR